jgi:cell division protein FtsW
VSAAEASAAPSVLAWWRSLDRVSLAAVVGLLAAGLLSALAASPAAAGRIGLDDPFYFLTRHGVYVIAALGALAFGARLSPIGARRLSVLMLFASVVMLTLVLFLGAEAKGATRWLRIGPVSVQPSEFAKPAFVVTAAWLIAEGRKADGPPGYVIGAVLYAAVAGLLLAQPDVGQTALLTVAFGGLVFVSGASWRWLAGLAAAGAGVAAAAYAFLPHVRARIDGFLGEGDTYQTDAALAAIAHGGLFGTGPGEGTVKHLVPDAHADYILAVAAEEFGLIFVAGLIGLIALFVIATLQRARKLVDGAARNAAAGLALLIGFQALINIAVNLNLIPPKGMTLPFVSYGGSSLVALGLAAGMTLAFTRRRPGAYPDA